MFIDSLVFIGILVLCVMGFIGIGDTSWEPTAKKDSKKSHYLCGGYPSCMGWYIS